MTTRSTTAKRASRLVWLRVSLYICAGLLFYGWVSGILPPINFQGAQLRHDLYAVGGEITKRCGGAYIPRTLNTADLDAFLSRMVSARCPTTFLVFRVPEVGHTDPVKSSMGDEQMRFVRQMKWLSTLDVSYTAVTDAGLSQIGTMSELRVLHAYGLDIGEHGLRSLADLPSLMEISVDDAVVARAKREYPDALRALWKVSINGRHRVWNDTL